MLAAAFFIVSNIIVTIFTKKAANFENITIQIATYFSPIEYNITPYQEPWMALSPFLGD
jgi:hypothetical protein